MTNICPSCGNKNKDISKFCESCGTTLSDVKKVIGSNKIPKSTHGVKKQKNIFDQMKDWWNERSPKGKGITGLSACCLGLLLVVGVSGLISPDANLTDLTVYGAEYDSDGEYHVDIDNKTTEYVINGSTEAGATVTVTSSELSVTNQKVQLDSNNAFNYKVKIPANVNEVKVRFDANKTGKDDSYIEVTIKKPSPVEPTPTTNTTTTTPATTTTTTTTDSKFSGLNHPSEVESVLYQFDYDYDDRIEFLDSYSSNQDGQEEYVMWAIAAGMDQSDSTTLTYMFNKYDANGDFYWNIYDIDNFYDDYYSN